jgi:hypothetical protein
MPWLDWIWAAWHRLNDERGMEVHGVGMPMGGTIIKSRPRRIPWTAVRAWSRHHRHSPDDMELLDHCLMAMDEEYLAWWQERQNAKG